jgi:hypothetical protein
MDAMKITQIDDNQELARKELIAYLTPHEAQALFFGQFTKPLPARFYLGYSAWDTLLPILTRGRQM